MISSQFSIEKKFSLNGTAKPSSELSEAVIKKRIQASVVAYWGNLYAHQPIEILLGVDCTTLYEDWLTRFQTRYEIVNIDKDTVLNIFETLKTNRIHYKKLGNN